MLRIIIIAFALFNCSLVSSQNAVSKVIRNLQAVGREFQPAEILHFQTQDIQHRGLNFEGLKKGTIISLDQNEIELLFQSQNEFISISVPITNRMKMVLTLKRHEIFTPDFKLYASDDRDHPVDYTPGLHYMGIVEGDESSVAAVSIFLDQIMALIATDEGNFVIGAIKGDQENHHIFYNDRDLVEDFPFECETSDMGLEYTQDQLSATQNNRDVNDCVRIYIEINDDIVTNKGGAVPATDYISGLFNQSLVLYTNEQLSLTISEILAWTTTSPYTGSSSSQMLGSYKANTEYFNGDLSHLVSFDSTYGGVAVGLFGICNGSPDNSKCFSGLRHNYYAVPIYSNPVMVVTHEMGHLMGSRHTQACVWNGNNTAIDGCVAPEGSCPQPPLPPDGGTIMSYCHVSNGSYYNFNLGFGPQPGNVIRNSVNASSNCLTPCGAPVAYCESNGVNSTQEYIDKIVVANINNQSGNNDGYENFTSLSANLNAGNTYTIALTPKFTGGNNPKYWRIWIDYNQDFDWYDAGECVVQGTGNNTITLNFTVPPGTPTISTRMRVSMKLAGYPAFCGTFPTGEVEDYTVNIIAITPTCSDGIQNQGETDVDCGGPCPACATCTDGIQNQGETGIDCGGPCSACPVSDSTVLLASYFETGWDSWIDGGPDVARVASSNSWEGQYSIELNDNSGAQSAMTSPTFNLSTAVGLKMSFHFYALSMEAGEDFWVQYKNGSGNWVTIGTFTSGSNFNNGSFYSATVTVPSFIPTTAGSLRIQCDASDNNDNVYIDAVIITKLNGNELIETGVTIEEVSGPHVYPNQILHDDTEKELVVYPNPTTGDLTVELPTSAVEGMTISVVGLTGQVLIEKVAEVGNVKQYLEVNDLPQGMYFLQIISDGRVLSVNKFVKQ